MNYDLVFFGIQGSGKGTQGKKLAAAHSLAYFEMGGELRKLSSEDSDLGKNVWVPPSVVMSGVYAFNDSVAHEWFAPAGLNRGGIDSAIQAERKLTQSNRDTLYSSLVSL